MTNQFPAERTSLALHLARGFTVSGAFSPRLLALNNQQLRNQDAELARSFIPMRAGSSFHAGVSSNA